MKQDNMRSRASEFHEPYFFHFLLWLIVFNVIFFAAFGLYNEGYFERMIEGDRSRISLLIAGIFICASCYVGGHIYRTGSLLARAEQLLVGKGIHLATPFAPMGGFLLVDQFTREIQLSIHSQLAGGGPPPELILEIYADKLRNPVEMSGFIIDVLIRLGLIGTIIGFIMMLQSFVAGPTPSAENIQMLLITMSSGMGTALYTTFAGLVASTLLGVQQQILSRNVEAVLALFIRTMDEVGRVERIEDV